MTESLPAREAGAAEKAEGEVASSLFGRLDDWREVASELEQLKRELYSDPQPSTEPKALAVLVCARLMNEMRCVILLTERGYALEAASICASMCELANTLGYIGDDVELTREWAAHDDEDDFRRPKKAINGATQKAGGDSSNAQMEYSHYKLLCTLKHGHPRAFRSFGFKPGDNGIAVFHGPYLSRGVLYLSRTMFFYACRYMWAGLKNYEHYHTPEAMRDFREQQLDQCLAKLQRLHNADVAEFEPPQPPTR